MEEMAAACLPAGGAWANDRCVLSRAWSGPAEILCLETAVERVEPGGAEKLVEAKMATTALTEPTRSNTAIELADNPAPHSCGGRPSVICTLHDFSLHNDFMGSARFLPLQVAAVCYRRRGASFDFLLVKTTSGDRWTFPKGATARRLSHSQA